MQQSWKGLVMGNIPPIPSYGEFARGMKLLHDLWGTRTVKRAEAAAESVRSDANLYKFLDYLYDGMFSEGVFRTEDHIFPLS